MTTLVLLAVYVVMVGFDTRVPTPAVPLQEAQETQPDAASAEPESAQPAAGTPAELPRLADPVVGWLTIEEARRRQAIDRKPIVRFFGAPNCGPCRTLRKRVLSQPAIVRYLNQNTLPVYENGPYATRITLPRLVIERDGKTSTYDRLPLSPVSFLASLSALLGIDADPVSPIRDTEA